SLLLGGALCGNVGVGWLIGIHSFRNDKAGAKSSLGITSVRLCSLIGHSPEAPR
ncbi:MAG: hypothetical protein RL385_162, partial [Pseudomonadota bacterium]